jgi:mitotic-spindle organizing protein 1
MSSPRSSRYRSYSPPPLPPDRSIPERGEDDDDDDENENENVVKISARKGKKVLDITHEMSRILDCDVDRETVAVCISLLENGADPESLAVVVKELKREAKRLRESRERATTTTRMMMENSRDGRRV